MKGANRAPSKINAGVSRSKPRESTKPERRENRKKSKVGEVR
jgi:hypothetical protein